MLVWPIVVLFSNADDLCPFPSRAVEAFRAIACAVGERGVLRKVSYNMRFAHRSEINCASF